MKDVDKCVAIKNIDTIVNSLCSSTKGGPQNFIGATYYLCNRQVNALIPSPPFTDTDIVLLTFGKGALERNVPDGTVAGGNCRGPCATDLQSVRNDPSQVASGIASVIGGGTSNTASGNGSVVTGGGSQSNVTGTTGNTASGTLSFIGGGSNNTAGGIISGLPTRSDTVSGGFNNQAIGGLSTVGGGSDNRASGQNSTIGGGTRNVASGLYSFVGGGVDNQSIGGGDCVGGGTDNHALGGNSFIGGGNANITTGSISFIGGGSQNDTLGQGSVISGGGFISGTPSSAGNGTSGVLSFIGAGAGNHTIGNGSSIVGGGQLPNTTSYGGNTTNGTLSFIGGGHDNTVGLSSSTIGDVITGGGSNQATGGYSFVGGGYLNNASVAYSGVPCGIGCTTPIFTSPSGSANNPTIVGAYNELTSTCNGSIAMFAVGGGTSVTNRKNLFTVDNTGSIYFPGGANSNCTDYAEIFESYDNSHIPAGTTVAFVPGTAKIKPAESTDTPFGVVSMFPSILGGHYRETLLEKYERNSDGSIIIDEEEVEYKTLVTEEREVTETIDDVDYSSNPPVIRKKAVTRKVHEQKLVEAVIHDDEGNEIGRRQVPLMKVEKHTVKKPRQNKPPTDDRESPFDKRWTMIGLVGILRVLKGQTVNPNWFFMKSEDKYDVYLVK